MSSIRRRQWILRRLEVGSVDEAAGDGSCTRGAVARSLVTVIIVGRSSILFRTTMHLLTRGWLRDGFSSGGGDPSGLTIGLPSQSISPRRHRSILR